LRERYLERREHPSCGKTKSLEFLIIISDGREEIREMRNIIIGTAGHVDHGKTALIRALTGMETDRLEEEKRRGLSIALGFAYFDLPDGSRAGIVDVPGHEKFIRTMLSGAYGLDIVLLVIDATEGVEEQTFEHLDILNLLGIPAGILVVTKVDIATPEQREDTVEMATEMVEGTTLEGSPSVCVSAVTGEGIDELKRTIVEKVNSLASQRISDGIPRLYVDRVFTMSGFGAVVTGTLMGGKLNKEQRVRIWPKGLEARVRGVQVHNEPAEQAFSGQRTALNLSGVRKEDIERGHVVCPENVSRVVDNMDVSINVLSSFPRMLEHWTRVRFYVGTTEVFGRTILLTNETLLPGDSSRIQIRLETPVLTFRGDRFIIRDFPAQYTIGGGMVLNPFAPKHKRFTEETRQLLEHWENADEGEVIRLLIEVSKNLCLEESLLRYYLPYSDAQLERLLKSLHREGEVIRWQGIERLFSSAQRIADSESILLEKLRQFHTENPLVVGQNISQLQIELEETIDETAFEKIVGKLMKEEGIAKDGNLLRLSEHKISFSHQEEEIKEEIEKLFLSSGLSTPSKEELIEDLQDYPPKIVEDTLYALVKLGTLVQVSEGIFFHSQILQQKIKLLTDVIRQKGKIATSEFRGLANTSRKYAVPFLEYCDSQGITYRDGNHRYLRKS